MFKDKERTSDEKFTPQFTFSELPATGTDGKSPKKFKLVVLISSFYFVHAIIYLSIALIAITFIVILKYQMPYIRSFNTEKITLLSNRFTNSRKSHLKNSDLMKKFCFPLTSNAHLWYIYR